MNNDFIKSITILMYLSILLYSCEKENAQLTKDCGDCFEQPIDTISELKCPTKCANENELVCTYTEPTPGWWDKCTSYYFIGEGNPSDNSAIQNAFSEWGESLGIDFIELFDKWDNKLDIEIRFHIFSDVEISDYQIESTCKGGEPLGSRGSGDGGPAASHIIKFNRKANWDGMNQSFNCDPVRLKTGTLHEIGHALGLGHTKDKSSVMYCFNEGQTELSELDINNAKNLFNLNLPWEITSFPVSLNGNWYSDYDGSWQWGIYESTTIRTFNRFFSVHSTYALAGTDCYQGYKVIAREGGRWHIFFFNDITVSHMRATFPGCPSSPTGFNTENEALETTSVYNQYCNGFQK